MTFMVAIKPVLSNLKPALKRLQTGALLSIVSCIGIVSGIVVSGIVVSGIVAADEQQDAHLYSVDRMVGQQSSTGLRDAGADALLVALSRLTGLASVPRSPMIAAALKAPENYYSRYAYFEQKSAIAGERGQLIVRFDFQADALRGLMRQANLPIWWTRRPQTLVWMVIEDPSGRRIISSDDPGEIVPWLLQSAEDRGLPLTLPLMDLEDSVAVAAADVVGKFSETLAQASSRYGVRQHLIGRFRVQEILSKRLFTGDWELLTLPAEGALPALAPQPLANRSRGSVAAHRRDLAGANAQQVAEVAIDLAVRSLLDSQQVYARNPQSFNVRVTGVASLPHYKSLLDYLTGLEFIEAVALTAARGDELRLVLRTAAPRLQLLDLLAEEGRLLILEPPSTAPQGAGPASARTGQAPELSAAAQATAAADGSEVVSDALVSEVPVSEVTDIALSWRG